MQDQEKISPTRRVRDPFCSAEELDSLVGITAKIDCLIASHGNASSKTLTRLAESRNAKTREGVTANPNTPKNVLLNWLAEGFPKALLLNPAFDLMVLEHPGFLSELYVSTLAAILRQPECPSTILEWAFDHYSKGDDFSPVILIALAQNPATRVSMIWEILRMDAPTEITGAEGML